jgi:chitinase
VTTGVDAIATDADADSGSSDAALPTDASTTTGQWVMGYYVGYNSARYPVASIDWTALTHIIMAPLVVTSSGAIDTTFAFATNAQGATFARQVSTAAHANGVKALLMLGGAGLSDNVKPAMANLPAFVQTLLTTMSDLGYDGLDLDVEASNFSLDNAITLASALRAASPSILLTFPGSTLQYQETVNPKIVQLATYLDRYNMQSYMGGKTGMFTGSDSGGGRFESWFYGALSDIGPLRRYAIDYALSHFAAAGIPRSKLGMGISFYAACYKTPDTNPPSGIAVSGPRMATGAPSDWCWDCGIGGGDNNSSYNYFYAGNGILATSTPSEMMWDNAASVPYLSFATAKSVNWCGGQTRFITYEDERSIIAKGAFSRSNGYGGVIIWTIDQGWLPTGAAGGRAQNALMQALRDGFLVP